jgi:hypothetical protein
MWPNAQLEVIRVAAEAQEEAEKAQEAKERAEQGPSALADSAALRAFVARVRHQPVEAGGALAEAIAAADYQDAVETQQRARCHSILDAWVSNEGGNPEQLRELLGTREAAVRATMAHQREDLRARAQRAEARRSELERLVERQGRQIAYLQSQVTGASRPSPSAASR